MSIFDKFDRTILRNLHMEHETINRTPDHIEMGSSAKGGSIKVYGDFNKPDEFKSKIDKALELRAYCNSRMYGSGDPNSKQE